jgi:hypothetical protein
MQSDTWRRVAGGPGLSLSDKIAADHFGRARSKLSLLLAYTTARSSEIPLPG